MSDIQDRVAQLEAKGWTLKSIADEIGLTVNAIEKWKAGDRKPSNSKATQAFLDQLLKRKHIPPKRRYGKNSRKKNHAYKQ